MNKYLKDDQYYVDQYDKDTVVECMDWYQRIRDGLEKKRNSTEYKHLSKEQFDQEIIKAASYFVNIIKAQRYRRRAETIQKWKFKDTSDQERFDNATPPSGITCKNCFSPMEVISKDVLDTKADKIRVLFMYECFKCKKRRALYEDGTEWHRDPVMCPKCKSELNDKSKITKNAINTHYSCSLCTYKKKDVYDFRKLTKVRELRTTREDELFAKYRKELCLDDKNGPEYLRSLEQISAYVEEMREKKKKESDPLYQKAGKLKRLTFHQLMKLLEGVLKKNLYKDLKFGKPEMDKYVIVDFTVNDAKKGRSEYESQNTLKKLIKEILEDTNWRLMSEGIQYRLGILTGNLKAYESDDDLINLVK